MIQLHTGFAGRSAGLFSPERDKTKSLIASAISGIATLAFSASFAMAQYIGPSTTVDPYLLPTHPDIKTASILTTGEKAADGYQMVGIPDGLGAFNINKKYFKLMANQELGATSGIVREHGSKGAFVSEWLIERDTLEVIAGQDHAPDASYVFQYSPTLETWLEGTTAWNRFCSADLPAVSALYFSQETKKGTGKNAKTSREIFGTDDRIFLNGEESSNPAGRAWAHVVSGPFEGESWELPRLGKMAFENVVANPHAQRKTVVMLNEDGNQSTAAATGASNVFVYIGTKQKDGHPIEQAGLTNGKLYGIKVLRPNKTLITGEDNVYGLGNSTLGFQHSARFVLQEMGPHGDVSAFSGGQLDAEALAENVFRLQRVEDGAWDPRKRHTNDYYFVTTAAFNDNSRLWRLRFDDIENPENGGKIEILLKGSEGQKMFDNLAVDNHGRIILQEDIGNNAAIGKVWLYGIDSGNLVQIAEHNKSFFDPNATDKSRFLTQDEESSGVIDAEETLGRGWFLLDVQNHKTVAPSPDPNGLVEGGQLLALYVDPALEDDEDIDF